MTDLLLDETDDLAYVDGDLVVVGATDDPEDRLAEIRQSLQIAYRTGLREWAFDLSAGIAYRGVIRTAAPNWTAIEGEFRRVGEAREGVTRVAEVIFDHDPDARTLSVTIRVETIYGPVEVAVTA